MRLGVLADTRHHRDGAGRLCAASPVAAQLEQLAAMFDEVVLCVPVHPGPPPAGFRPYGGSRFSVVPLRPGGGDSAAAKAALAARLPGWAAAMAQVIRRVDALHLRSPCNIGLLGLLAARVTTKPRYAMYAGSWHGYPGEPWSYRLQRRLLASKRFGGPVTVYTDQRPTAPHLVPFFSPTCARARWEASSTAVAERLDRLASGRPIAPVRLVTVGDVSANKNQRVVLQAVGCLRRRGLDVRLEVVGDGPLLGELRRLAASTGLEAAVRFRGRLGPDAVGEAFRRADLNVLSSVTEGFPKVVVEGMVEGAVPITSRFPMAAHLSGDGRRGVTFDHGDHEELAARITELAASPARVAAMVRSGRAYAATVTLESFGDQLRALLEERWGVVLPPAGPARTVEAER